MTKSKQDIKYEYNENIVFIVLILFSGYFGMSFALWALGIIGSFAFFYLITKENEKDEDVEE